MSTPSLESSNPISTETVSTEIPGETPNEIHDPIFEKLAKYPWGSHICEQFRYYTQHIYEPYDDGNMKFPVSQSFIDFFGNLDKYLQDHQNIIVTCKSSELKNFNSCMRRILNHSSFQSSQKIVFCELRYLNDEDNESYYYRWHMKCHTFMNQHLDGGFNIADGYQEYRCIKCGEAFFERLYSDDQYENTEEYQAEEKNFPRFHLQTNKFFIGRAPPDIIPDIDEPYRVMTQEEDNVACVEDLQKEKIYISGQLEKLTQYLSEDDLEDLSEAEQKEKQAKRLARHLEKIAEAQEYEKNLHNMTDYNFIRDKMFRLLGSTILPCGSTPFEVAVEFDIRVEELQSRLF